MGIKIEELRGDEWVKLREEKFTLNVTSGYVEVRAYFEGLVGMSEHRHYDKEGNMLSVKTKPTGVVLVLK